MHLDPSRRRARVPGHAAALEPMVMPRSCVHASMGDAACVLTVHHRRERKTGTRLASGMRTPSVRYSDIVVVTTRTTTVLRRDDDGIARASPAWCPDRTRITRSSAAPARRPRRYRAVIGRGGPRRRRSTASSPTTSRPCSGRRFRRERRTRQRELERIGSGPEVLERQVLGLDRSAAREEHGTITGRYSANRDARTARKSLAASRFGARKNVIASTSPSSRPKRASESIWSRKSFGPPSS